MGQRRRRSRFVQATLNTAYLKCLTSPMMNQSLRGTGMKWCCHLLHRLITRASMQGGIAGERGRLRCSIGEKNGDSGMVEFGRSWPSPSLRQKLRCSWIGVLGLRERTAIMFGFGHKAPTCRGVVEGFAERTAIARMG